MSIILALALASMTEAKQVIADTTVNPSAVQFKNVREGEGVVCGEFNAPTPAGGYKGFDVFIYVSRGNWSTGLMDGKFMVNGKLIDVDELRARTRGVGTYRYADESDVADTMTTSEVYRARRDLLKLCPRPAHLDAN